MPFHLTPQEIRLISLDANASFLLALRLAERKNVDLHDLVELIKSRSIPLLRFGRPPTVYSIPVDKR